LIQNPPHVAVAPPFACFDDQSLPGGSAASAVVLWLRGIESGLDPVPG
jgi:hypothetical protein